MRAGAGKQCLGCARTYTTDWHREEELHRLRSLEMKAASEKRRRAAIDSFWTGGGLRLFLHPPSPSLHSPMLRGQVPTSITIQGAFILSANLSSRLELVEISQAAVQDGAQVLAMGSKPRFITDLQEWVATWEQWLGEVACATKQRCCQCASQALKMIPCSTGVVRGGSARAHE